MATFTCNDIDGFVLDMQEFARLPDGVIEDILRSGAEVIRKAHVEAINTQFGNPTGKLMGSPGIKIVKGARYALIYPMGTHHTYHAKKGSGVARNAEVGFVQEFGGHGNQAHAWMLTANEKSADETAEAEAKVYDNWLKTLNL